MILRFVDEVEKAIDSHPTVLSSTFQKQFGPDNKSLYLKSTVIFTDLSVLELSIFAVESRNKVIVDKYRYHYMDKRSRLVFRYDNAPHHRDLPSFPDHKHLPDKAVTASAPSLPDVLNEISAFIIGR